MPGYAEEELAAMSLKPNGNGNGFHANGKEEAMGVTAFGDHSRSVLRRAETPMCKPPSSPP